MKRSAIFLALALVSFGFSSCCLFSGSSTEYRTETKQVKTSKYDIVTTEVRTSGKGGMVETIEQKVPRYKTVTKKVRVPKACTCTRYYCAEHKNAIKMATTQGSSGSPNLGLIPTMRSLAP